MSRVLRKHAATIVVAVVTAAVTAGAPSLAAAAFDALNAHKVDGKHAVGAKATKKKRAGKLLATNAKGVFPNNVISKALDANRLDGLDSSAFRRKYAQVKIVAKSGGDFTTINAALGSISDASANKHYLVFIAPGTYQQKVAMKPFVDLMGAGVDSTKITCACAQLANLEGGAGGPATVNGASNSTLARLTVVNSGGASAGEALSGDADTNFVVEDVKLISQAESAQWGAFFRDSTVTLRNVQVDLDLGSGDQASGIEQINSALTIADSAISVTGASASIGVEMTLGSLDIADSDITASAVTAGFGTGIENSGGTVTARDIHVDASGGGNVYIGVENFNGSMEIINSHIEASGAGAPTGVMNHTSAGNPGSLLLMGTRVNVSGGSLPQAFRHGSLGTTITKIVSSHLTTTGGTSENRGIGASSGTLTVDGSRIEASTWTVSQGGTGTVRIGGSALAGGAVTGTITCAQVWDENYVASDTVCP
jgi:hypothetical protein